MKAKELTIWTIILAVLIGGIWLLISFVNSSPSPSTSVEIKNLPAVSKDDFVRGNSNAKVTLVEYADFQCSACGSIYPIVKKLEGDFKNDLRVVFRFFPLTDSHQNSMIAAQAAYAASLQGKFWEIHDMIFENQDKWSNNTLAKDIFVGYAKTLGLNLSKFESDMGNESTIKFITGEQEKGLTLGINSTPTFFVNGKYIQSPTGYEEFKKIIQDEINKK